MAHTTVKFHAFGAETRLITQVMQFPFKVWFRINLGKRSSDVVLCHYIRRHPLACHAGGSDILSGISFLRSPELRGYVLHDKMARVHELDSTCLKRPLLESVSVYNLWGHQLGKKKNSTYPSTRRAALPAFLKRLFLGKRVWEGPNQLFVLFPYRDIIIT